MDFAEDLEVKYSMEMSMEINELFQKADWKKEKHVPVIECPSSIKKDELCEVKVSIGKEIAHPNTTEHHIAWVSIFFKPNDDKFPYQLGQYIFNAHGASAQECNVRVAIGLSLLRFRAIRMRRRSPATDPVQSPWLPETAGRFQDDPAGGEIPEFETVIGESPRKPAAT